MNGRSFAGVVQEQRAHAGNSLSAMAQIRDFRCVVCGQCYPDDCARYTCETCGEVGTLDIRYDLAALSASIDRDALAIQPRADSMWRYRALLPLAEEAILPPPRVGGTPIYETPALARELGLARLWVKDDGRNPTASLKDRASAMVIAHALSAGHHTVSTASTGNAAAALAGIAASLPGALRAVIFVPATAPIAKITQLQIYGATVALVDGSYDEAFALCLTLSERAGWHCRNTGINPYTSEGKKTAAYEIAEALGWQAPAAVITSVGDGSIIGSLYKGFQELVALGWIATMPRLIGAQAEGSDALYRAWRNGAAASSMRAQPVATVADSIAAGLPRDRAKALRAVRESDGAFVTISDEQILAAIPQLAQASGVFAEPAAAAALAGARQAVADGILATDDEVVILVTGNGLKDVPAAQRALAESEQAQALRIPADLDAAARALGIEA